MKKSSINLLTLSIVILCFSLFCTSCQTEKVLSSSNILTEYVRDNGTLITAHRGYSKVAPENTISSFEAAINVGAEACEFDVHMSKDGVLVVIHDDTVDRTTNGNGKVNQLTYDYLSTLDAGSWKNDKFKGEKIPTLLETLTYLKNNGTIAVLEIKDSNIVDEVINTIYEAEMNESTIIISFSKSAISKIIKTDPAIPALLLLSKRESMAGTIDEKTDKYIKITSKTGTNLLGPFAFQLDEIDPLFLNTANYNIKNGSNPGTLPLSFNEETIKGLHDNGYYINTWTVDNSDNMRALISYNIDMLTTNYLEKALEIKQDILEK